MTLKGRTEALNVKELKRRAAKLHEADRKGLRRWNSIGSREKSWGKKGQRGGSSTGANKGRSVGKRWMCGKK